MANSFTIVTDTSRSCLGESIVLFVSSSSSSGNRIPCDLTFVLGDGSSTETLGVSII